jgi:mono/diheme cytochrome c family protein
MSARLVGRDTCWQVVPLVGVLSMALLPGCGGDGYSDAIVYGLREDPILKGSPEKTIPTNYPFLMKPDPPGQLPLMNMAGVKDPRNPFYRDYFKPKNQDDLAKKMQEYDEFFIDPTQLYPEGKKILRAGLDRLFGTPARPRVNVPGVSPDIIDELKLDRTSLALGSKLYRLQCLQCHGVPGDGRGPTAQWVNPHPRDYRAGIFKFQSVNQAENQDRLKPTRADLFRTLYLGVEGTSMPAFNLLTSDELESLVSYVMHLSIRGETEQNVLTALAATKGTWPNGPLEEYKIEAQAAKIVKNWKESQSQLIKPADNLARKLFKKDEAELTEAERTKFEEEKKSSILRGQALITQKLDQLKKYLPKDQFAKTYPQRVKKAADFKDAEYEQELANLIKSANCITCHMDYGQRAEMKFDEWGTLVKPANWTIPVYRGGRRPVDLYYRIHSGISGSGMPSFGKESNGLSGEQIWDLVNFLQVLPYPAMRNKYGVVFD